jgi:hypothetical protein
MRLLLAALLAAGCGSTSTPSSGPPWLADASVLVQGVGVTNRDCRSGICRHNENTDLIAWKGAIWLVHRTAQSQILGPNSALHIYRSTDNGAHFTETAHILAPLMPTGRDIRDPCFYTVGDRLFIKALTRLPVTSTRDSNVDTVAVATSSADGINWDPIADVGPHGWSFWRIKEQGGTLYTAAYADGDLSIALFTSTDGMTWTRGADVYTMSADTPVETELQFLPSGRVVALVRMDGTDQELLGDQGRLRTKVCFATPPYSSFDCSGEIDGQRLDGPLSFMWQGRMFVVARKHLQGTGRKRTSLFEITGTLEGGPVTAKEWGEVPSAGDTAYAGAAAIDANRMVVTWYSSDIVIDENWVDGILDDSDIWRATIDLSKLQ